jgi:hypothetical protein
VLELDTTEVEELTGADDELLDVTPTEDCVLDWLVTDEVDD